MSKVVSLAEAAQKAKKMIAGAKYPVVLRIVPGNSPSFFNGWENEFSKAFQWFDGKLDWPKEIDGVAMDGYIAWMRSAYWITTTFRPAISVPAGFTPEGLPVGIQIVGRYRDDLGVLKIAHAFEQATGVGRRRPPVERDRA